jgi:hypothetical protein
MGQVKRGLTCLSIHGSTHTPAMHPAILHEIWVKLKGASHAYRYMSPHATRLRTLALDLYSSSSETRSTASTAGAAGAAGAAAPGAMNPAPRLPRPRRCASAAAASAESCAQVLTRARVCLPPPRRSCRPSPLPPPPPLLGRRRRRHHAPRLRSLIRLPRPPSLPAAPRRRRPRPRPSPPHLRPHMCPR